MKAPHKTYRLVPVVLALGMLAIMAGNALASTSSSGGTGGVVYNAIPSKLPGSVPSQGFECCHTSEFGDQVILGGSGRTLQSMSVVLVSWACQSGRWYNSDCVTPSGASFEVPLTFSIYDDHGGTVVPGDLIATLTKTVNVQYRPSANDTKCVGTDDGKWYSKTDHTCYNGFAQTFKANLATTLGGPLPSEVIWSVAYNTSTAGKNPIGTTQACYTSSGGCGYDSLNVGAYSAPNAPYVGTDKVEAQVFRCDSVTSICAMEGTAGDPNNDWTGFRPLGSISATK